MAETDDFEKSPLLRKNKNDMWKRYLKADLEKVEEVSGSIHAKLAGEPGQGLLQMGDPGEHAKKSNLGYESKILDMAGPRSRKKEEEESDME